MQTVFSNGMTCHVWANQSQLEGRSSNGNISFHGRSLYSYGTHYLLGFIMPDRVAFLNSHNYSITTSKHQTYASRAVSGTRFYINDMTQLGDTFDRVAWIMKTRREGKSPAKENADYYSRSLVRIREALLVYADLLRGNGSRYDRATDQSEVTSECAGQYLANAAGIGRAWPAIVKAADKRNVANAKASAIKTRKHAKALAIRYADMSPVDWRLHMRKDHSKYESFYDREAKALFHAQRTAKAEGLSAKRQAMLKYRRAYALARKNGYEDLSAQHKRWDLVRRHIATIRSARDILAENPKLPYTAPVKHGATKAALAALGYLIECQCFPSASRERMRFEIARLMGTLPALAALKDAHEAEQLAREQAEYRARMEVRRIERENEAKEQAEKIELWKKGENVRVYFDSEHGGAALRVMGDMLQTSHGAEVPLSHAVKVFRFAKMIRLQNFAPDGTPLVKETVTNWARNGKTIRVGHFQVDRVGSNGSFQAGCHQIAWEEVERVARAAGVYEEQASADALEASN
jgi:hypothetical protein